MNLIEWINGVTKLNKETMDTFQTNIKKAIDNINTNKDMYQKNITIQEEIIENTNYTIPLKYIVGNNSLEIYYMGERLIKDVHYIEVGEINSISNTIQFKDWGMNVPIDRQIEFIVKGVDQDE